MQNGITAKAGTGYPHRLEAFAASRDNRPYKKPGGWVFASRRQGGRKPIQGQAIPRKLIRPKARELGIEKRFGWNAFRLTYSSLL